MHSIDARVVALAANQHALVTRRQLVGLGLTDRMIDRRIAVGLLVSVARGILRIGGAPVTWRQRVLAACLAGGPGCVASHRTAAALHRLDDFGPGDVEVSLPRSRRFRSSGITVHHMSRLDRVDVTVVDGVPVTTIARTLVDLAGVLDPARLEEVLDGALRDGLVRRARIRWRIGELGLQGRRGLGGLAALLDDHAAGPVPRSVLERRFLRAIERRGLPRPSCQVPVRRPGGRMAYVDFLFEAAHLAVEVDGHRSHATRRQRRNDAERANALVLADLRLLRFTYEHVMEAADYAAEVCEQALRRAA